jgi:hypothetical protein
MSEGNSGWDITTMAENLGPLPEVHPRAIVVEQATRALQGRLIDIAAQHRLTDAETLQVVADVAHKWVMSIANGMTRRERE